MFRLLRLVPLAATMVVAAAPADLTFERLGDPVKQRALGFSCVTHSPDGYDIAWAGFLEAGLGSSALVGVRTDTGEVIWHDFTAYHEGKVTVTLGADGNVYCYAGAPGHFFRVKAATDALEDLGAPDPRASYYAAGDMGPDGVFYVGSYPDATLVACDTNTGEVRNLGRMPEDEKQFYIYPSVAVSDDNVVYCPTGLHHKEVWAYDVATGVKRQILPADLTAKQGSVTVWTGADGQVYGRADGLEFRCLPDRIEMGKTASERSRPPLTTGGRTIRQINEAGELGLEDPATGEVTWLPTNYAGARAFVFSVSCERGGKIYGSAALPGRSFVYDPTSGGLTDLGIIGSGACQVYDTISLPQGLFLCSYMGAYVDVYKPEEPRREGENPRCLGNIAGQERPVQWCVGPDGMLYSGTVPAKGRLGGAIMRVDPDALTMESWPTPVPNQSVMYLAPVPETGELLGATSTEGGSSAIPTEKAACIFLWDPVRAEMTFRADPVPGTTSYGRLVRAGNGLIYGIAGGRYFAFDPVRREVVFVGDLPVKSACFPGLHDQPVGPRGLLYGMGDEAVFAIDPADHSVSVVARDPVISGAAGRPAHGFFVTDEGVLYFGAGATLVRCRLLP